MWPCVYDMDTSLKFTMRNTSNNLTPYFHGYPELVIGNGISLDVGAKEVDNVGVIGVILKDVEL